jgi:hypothetical protein
MSHRSIHRDPIKSRRDAYQELEKSGEQQEAIMEAFALLSKQGTQVGAKMAALIEKRTIIKGRNPK